MQHWYPLSPFAQKVAWVLNYKNVNYKTVQISPIEPRPLRRPLDGSYRKTPILQIGNKVYCDSKRIFAEIERRFPEPSLYPKTKTGQPTLALCQALSHWTDNKLFMAVPTQFPLELMPRPFLEDRAKFAGSANVFDVEKSKVLGPLLRAELHARLLQAQALIGDKPWILETEALSAADLHVAFVTFFALNVLTHEWMKKHVPELVNHFERVKEAIRFARTEEMPKITAEEALEVAKRAPTTYSVPDPTSCSPALKVGQMVSVTPLDSGKVPAVGKLLSMTLDEVILERRDEQTGIVAYIHFPVIGFIVAPVSKL